MERVVGPSPAKDRPLGIAARSILGVAAQAITAERAVRRHLGPVRERMGRSVALGAG